VEEAIAARADLASALGLGDRPPPLSDLVDLVISRLTTR
jgi:hypothetical protein